MHQIDEVGIPGGSREIAAIECICKLKIVKVGGLRRMHWLQFALQSVLDDVPGQDREDFRETIYLGQTSWRNPTSVYAPTFDYLQGVREDSSGADGEAN